MQVQKISIRRAILEVAREELFEKGFKGTSMRSIAQKSEVGLSNIYNYFKNKDEILLAVIQPLLNAIDKMEAEHNDEKNLNIELLSSDAFLKENIVKMVNLVEGFRRELRLLFFHAYGSSLENFKNEFIDRSTRMGIEFLRKIKAKYPFLNTEISPFFVHVHCSFEVTIICEVVAHEELSHIELERFMTNYMQFSTAGWKTILGA